MEMTGIDKYNLYLCQDLASYIFVITAATYCAYRCNFNLFSQPTHVYWFAKSHYIQLLSSTCSLYRKLYTPLGGITELSFIMRSKHVRILPAFVYSWICKWDVIRLLQTQVLGDCQGRRNINVRIYPSPAGSYLCNKISVMRILSMISFELARGF